MQKTGLHPFPQLQDVVRLPDPDGAERLQLVTNIGTMAGRLRLADADEAILWVFGAGGGLGGPAGGLYTRLGDRLQHDHVTSLELDYRHPGYLQECLVDVLVGLSFLESLGKNRIVLVGHSFGGAVVINAGAVSDAVIAVAALSSQTAGTEAVGALSPRPVLFVHGELDEIMPAAFSRELYARAGEPKELILYPGCLHGLDQCRHALDLDLSRWLANALGGQSASAAAQG
jgi:fermentation-respiration switch protein FrsA (DUF1100 family)